VSSCGCADNQLEPERFWPEALATSRNRGRLPLAATQMLGSSAVEAMLTNSKRVFAQTKEFGNQSLSIAKSTFVAGDEEVVCSPRRYRLLQSTRHQQQSRDIGVAPVVKENANAE